MCTRTVIKTASLPYLIISYSLHQSDIAEVCDCLHESTQRKGREIITEQTSFQFTNARSFYTEVFTNNREDYVQEGWVG